MCQGGVRGCVREGLQEGVSGRGKRVCQGGVRGGCVREGLEEGVSGRG